mmetsp:Transcript_5119/g.6613  ORF Transcript_5119/g.6613 Transcript_5119/m.6613 type:complete len:417 (-) Transcript_5119:183-1433(-)
MNDSLPIITEHTPPTHESFVPVPNSGTSKKGRAARRRQNKIRSIRQSVQFLLSGVAGEHEHSKITLVGVDEDDSSISCLPQDRNRSLPGAITRRIQCNGCTDEGGYENESAKPQEGQNIGFDKKDESMLTSQLGFIPGNGVSVVSRVKAIQNLYPCLYKLLSKATSTAVKNNSTPKEAIGCDFPTTLQLYPLVIREVYAGGKSDGRKFKSRKRGHNQINKNGNDETVQANTAQEKSKDANHENSNTTNDSSTSESTIEPFPTMYWLTHPYLRALISQLEIEPQSNVKTMEEKISSSQAYLEAMTKAHQSYGNCRWDMLTDEDKQYVKERGWVTALNIERGVAGIRRFGTVKCLHAHAAHYLAHCGVRDFGRRNDICSDSVNHDNNENLVGRWVLEAVEELVKNGVKTSREYTKKIE